VNMQRCKSQNDEKMNLHKGIGKLLDEYSKQMKRESRWDLKTYLEALVWGRFCQTKLGFGTSPLEKL
jgi:hypothetical protein